MTITPLRAQVLVELETTLESKAASDLVVVRQHVQPSVWATVIAVGPECREVAPGARVVVSRLQGVQVGAAVLLPESAVLAHAETSDD
jgi:co-chaperonin GroES (HSP10)